MPSDLGRSLAFFDKSLQCDIWYERSRPGRIGFLFDVVIVITCNNVPVLVFALYRQPARFMTQEHVTNFFHQRRTMTIMPVCRVEDDQLSTVRQRLRRRAARPHVLSLADEVLF